MPPSPLIRKAAPLLAILGSLLGTFAQAQTTRPANTDSDSLLHFLLKENAMSRERIKTASYKLDWAVEDLKVKGGWQPWHATAQIHRDGGKFCSIWNMTVRRSTSPAQLLDPPGIEWNGPVFPVTMRFVINDSYIAYRDNDEALYAYVYDHLSIAQRSDRSKSKSESKMPPDILWFAFGDGLGSVDQDIEITKKQYEWTAAEDPEPGRHIYRIKAFLREPRATVPRYDIKIDADQGFLITEFLMNTQNGVPHTRHTISTARIGAEEIVFPVAIKIECYAGSNRSRAKELHCTEQTLIRRETFSVDSISLNQSISEDQFSIKSLEIPADRIVMRNNISGQVSHWRVIDGQLVTEADAKRLGAPPDILHENAAAAAALATAAARESIKANRSFLDKATSMPQFALEALAVAAIALATRLYAVRRARRKIQN
jgi:hypothetical protein